VPSEYVAAMISKRFVNHLTKQNSCRGVDDFGGVAVEKPAFYETQNFFVMDIELFSIIAVPQCFIETG
jgi:hypothetical protein